MKFVMEAFRKQELIEQLPVILMEIDYELLTLFEALQANDTVQIIKAKEKLKDLRLKKIEIEKESNL
ncbi:hypothetical protein KQI49_16560 [Virgibacillus sp. MSJ-26]|uniref:hypothetical protein n=1 Tax=Virgibacillus sp. MSJ-26 TaxID=2841522 RepID=UPI001C120987|nr:hypothetical protein [Virgibacillus sp. MSJ-26]MBU5468438.1 hypothetical protein [Virgibacillus sp. MSJ-26]